MNITLPKELVDEVNRLNPFPWVQHVHPNGLIQIADRNGAIVDIFLLIKVAIITGIEVSRNAN